MNKPDHEPKGEQIINCPFCDDDPKARGHFQVTKWIFERPDVLVTQVGLTCMNALPDPEKSDWYQFTWFVTERIASKKPQDRTFHKEAEHEPRIPLTEEDEAWAQELGKLLDPEAPDA